MKRARYYRIAGKKFYDIGSIRRRKVLALIKKKSMVIYTVSKKNLRGRKRY